MQQLSAQLFSLLRQMDAEASGQRAGYPIGLNYYGAHYQPDMKRPRTEPCWSQRCAELWPAHGYHAEAEVAYPHLPRTKCDNVITLPDGKKLWLEIKGAWKDYWTEVGNLTIYRSYLLHPLLPGLDKSKTHTAALDLEKLRPLKPPFADYVGLLLIGFYTDDATMVDDVKQFQSLAGLDSAPWTADEDAWKDVYRPGGNVHAWLWT